MMHQKKIGSVIVKNKSLGIFTERDLLTNVLTNNVNMDMPVKGYCTYPLITAKYGITASQAADMMAQNRIKRLGLIKNNSLTAIVTARDIVDAYQSTYPTSDPYLENN
jgi:CBS domain-containing protein